MNKYQGTSTLESMSQARFYNSWTLSKFDKFLKGTILEVGCGIGNFTKTLSKYGKVTAIDIDQDLAEKIKTDKNPNVIAGYGDVEKGKYFFGKQEFDSVVCLNVLEHINDDQSALNNLFSLLKTGGRLILLIPAHQFLYGQIDRSIDHYRRYNKSEIIGRLKGIGFKINESRLLNFLGAIGWFVAGKIMKDAVVKKGNIKIFNLIAPMFLRLEDWIEPPIGTSILIIAQKP